MDGLGRTLGEGLASLELFATLVAAFVTLLAWSLLLFWGRTRSGLRAVGLGLVVAIHLLPLSAALADASPAASWSLAAQWRSWGSTAAWSVPGIAALFWFAPSISEQRHALVRAASTAIYAALIGVVVFVHAPGALRDSLTEIVTTPREQWACGTTANGAVYCMGGNHDGQLGASDEPNIERPRQVEELSPSSALFMGTFMTCGLTPPSTVRCIGRWRGAAKQQIRAESSLVVERVLVAESELVFVSREGAVEVWSESGVSHVAARSADQVHCGGSILLIDGGQAELRHTASGRRAALGPARAISCERRDRSARPAVLNGRELRYFTSSGELDETVEVTATATFAPSEDDVELRDGDREARCAAGVALFSRVAVSCDWHDSKRKPLLLRGSPEEHADSGSTHAAQELGRMSLAAR